MSISKDQILYLAITKEAENTDCLKHLFQDLLSPIYSEAPHVKLPGKGLLLLLLRKC